MAVCNIFTELNKPTGNFLMFSNYTEDICKYSVFDSNYRVVPSKFYALDADFKPLLDVYANKNQQIIDLKTKIDRVDSEISGINDNIKFLESTEINSYIYKYKTRINTKEDYIELELNKDQNTNNFDVANPSITTRSIRVYAGAFFSIACSKNFKQVIFTVDTDSKAKNVALNNGWMLASDAVVSTSTNSTFKVITQNPNVNLTIRGRNQSNTSDAQLSIKRIEILFDDNSTQIIPLDDLDFSDYIWDVYLTNKETIIKDNVSIREQIDIFKQQIKDLRTSVLDDQNTVNQFYNTIIPRKFQNRYENWLALQKNGVFEDSSFNPAGALWQFLFGIGLLDLVGYVKDDVKNNDKDVVDENLYNTNIVYEGTINLESYDLHNDTGYAEIVCHIPSETSAKTYSMRPGTSVIIKIDKNYIEGFEGDDTYALDEDDKEVNYFTNINTTKGLELEATNNSNTKYKFNTIVVCYDVYEGGTLKYTDLPLGVYFMGLFNGTTMENEKTIYIANGDAFGASTTYTLRICTRFTPSTSSDKLGTVVDDDNANLGYLLSKLADSMNTMEEILKNAHTDNVTLKDTLNIIKNNRTNVPYLVSGGENTPQYWYVNGKCISEVPFNTIATSQEVDKTFEEILGV